MNIRLLGKSFWMLALFPAVVFAFAAFGRENFVVNSRAVKIIVGEAADQNLAGKIAVAEVIRNRGGTKGFSSSRKNLDKFFRSQPRNTQEQARFAWFLSRFTNLSRGADHFDNVKRFGEPSWAKGMKKTVVIDDMQYYRSKSD